MNKVYYLLKFVSGGKTDTPLAVRDNTRVAWIPEKMYKGEIASAEGSILRGLWGNNIVDFDNVSPYFKDADRGEIGAHLSEVPSYLGFKKETLIDKYQTPEGKTKINKDDIKNYLRFQKENGVNIEHSIF